MKIHDDDDQDGFNDFLYDRYARDNSAIWYVVVVSVLVFAVVGLLATAAMAHDFYSVECCNDQDCSPLPDGAVTITKDGYVWKGELFPYGEKRIKYSPDGKYHGCELAYTKTKICLYVPPQGA